MSTMGNALLDLSMELILGVASYLYYEDLLNMGLTCKYLNSAVEPELYRDYSNIAIRGPPFSRFVMKLIQRPELCKYVQRLDLRTWDTLDAFNPAYYCDFEQLESGVGGSQKEAEFDGLLEKCPSHDEYLLLTESAKATGIIEEIFPWELESYLGRFAQKFKMEDMERSKYWYTHAFGEDLDYSEISHDRKFCQMLRAGLDDPFAVLMLALTPNVKEIVLRGTPDDTTAIEWRASHGFSALRHLTACGGIDVDSVWPITYIDMILAKGKLKSFETRMACSWAIDRYPIEPDPNIARTLSLVTHTLSLTHLDLQHCSLDTEDVQTLLQACQELKSFSYSTPELHEDVERPSPAEIIDLLRPFKESLEILRLDVDIEPFMMSPGLISSRLIGSLAHMTRLKYLETGPELWDHIEDDDFESDSDDISTLFAIDPNRLSFRLPPNIETLVFYSPKLTEETIPSRHLGDILRAHTYRLPQLTHLYVGNWSPDEEEPEDCDVLMELRMLSKNNGRQSFKVSPGRGPLTTVFDGMFLNLDAPRLKWLGNKYVMCEPGNKWRRVTNPDAIQERVDPR